MYMSGTVTGFQFFSYNDYIYKNCRSRAGISQIWQIYSQFWIDLLEHSPDLGISTPFLHMKVKKTSGNIKNIPAAHVF